MLFELILTSLVVGAPEETLPATPTLTPIPESSSTIVPAPASVSPATQTPAATPTTPSSPSTQVAPIAPVTTDTPVTPLPPAPARIAGTTTEQAVLAKVPVNWYQGTSNLFDYCVEVKFAHPICPPINRMDFSEVDFNSEFFTPPTGPLNPQTLFQATVLYEVGRAPEYWLVGLGLDKKRPVGIDARLWAEAQYLWARLLYDRRQYPKALELYDQLVDEFKGKALFHQQRGWAQYQARKFDRSLGSIVSSESPLIFQVPFFDKFFLRSLIEKENCLYQQAMQTLQNGRKFFASNIPDAKKHPWVILCERKNLGAVCSRLENWYRARYSEKVKASLSDLDLLEIELRDRLTQGQKVKSEAKIVWPFVGENWKDELGYYSVPIKSSCL